MPAGNLDGVLHHICDLFALRRIDGLSDRDLLESFLTRQDEAAFAGLMRRHGAMVCGVCRRVLGHDQDAEDASQAVFLLLARKAATVRKQQSLGSWLHGAAFRVASNLKRERERRRARKAPAANVVQADTTSEVTWREVKAAIDEECTRLPERYRIAVVLCYLEGKTREEAARQLGCRLTTLHGRLERGRELLRARLTRRGLTLSAALFGTFLTEQGPAAAMSSAFLTKTAKAASLLAAGQNVSGLISSPVLVLVEGAAAMTIGQWKITVATVFTVGLLGLGAAGVGHKILAEKQAVVSAKPHPEAKPPAAKATLPPVDDKKSVAFSGRVLDPVPEPTKKPGGAVPVELVGVTRNTLQRRAQIWWKPDGTALTPPPYYYPYTYSNEQIPYEFAFRVREEDGFSYTFKGPSNKAVSEPAVPQDEAQKRLANLRAVVIGRFTETDTTASLRVGVATGAWVKVDVWQDYRWDEISGGTFNSTEQIIFKWPRQEKDGAVTEITHTCVDEATRLVAFDRQGKLYESIESQGGRGKGLVQQSCIFRGLKLKDIQRFEFQKRLYDIWFTLTNISLQPGHRTDPQTKRE